jgi:ribose/xylose/arabinose/galactoside ABC-type transport system permease subunit
MSAISSEIATPTSGQRQWQTWIPKAVPFTALLLLILVFSATPAFLTGRNFEAIINALPVLVMVAAGATFPILLGSIDLSSAGIIVLSGGVGAAIAARCSTAS